MSKDRDAKEFDADLKKSLEERGYTIHEIGGSLSRPDIIAIKDNIALIIETKSENESRLKDCLTWDGSPKHPYKKKLQDWREYCDTLPDKDVAVWMVHINVQAICYPIFFEKDAKDKDYYLFIKDKTTNKALEVCTRIPALAFPEIYKNHVQEAVRRMGIVIDESAFMKLPKGQLFLKFDSEQKMVKPPPNVGNSES